MVKIWDEVKISSFQVTPYFYPVVPGLLTSTITIEIVSWVIIRIIYSEEGPTWAFLIVGSFIWVIPYVNLKILKKWPFIAGT